MKFYTLEELERMSDDGLISVSVTSKDNREKCDWQSKTAREILTKRVGNVEKKIYSSHFKKHIFVVVTESKPKKSAVTTTDWENFLTEEKKFSKSVVKAWKKEISSKKPMSLTGCKLSGKDEDGKTIF